MKALNKSTIIEKLKQYRKESQYKEQIKELGLFGSYARNTNSAKSDVDIFVKLEPAKMFDLISIKEDLERLLGKKVDIITLRKSMNSFLRNQIRQEGIYV
jgi:predicted nucleotidyltransferase